MIDAVRRAKHHGLAAVHIDRVSHVAVPIDIERGQTKLTSLPLEHASPRPTACV